MNLSYNQEQGIEMMELLQVKKVKTKIPFIQRDLSLLQQPQYQTKLKCLELTKE
jgi:hypothetical protein